MQDGALSKAGWRNRHSAFLFAIACTHFPATSILTSYDTSRTTRVHYRVATWNWASHHSPFRQEGSSVFLATRTREELAATAAEIAEKGGQVAFAAADVSKEEDRRRIVEAAREKFGLVSILVNDAGHYGPVVPVEKYPLAEFDNVIAAHLRAAFVLTQLALPEMNKHERDVIYAAAKAGMLGLTRVTAAEAARKGVRVNAICPGPLTETVMSKELGATLAKKIGVSSQEQFAGFLQTIL